MAEAAYAAGPALLGAPRLPLEKEKKGNKTKRPRLIEI